MPRLTDISAAVKSFGCAARKCSTFTAYRSGSCSAWCNAFFSFFFTSPERYASAVSHSPVAGFSKICPRSSRMISSCGLPPKSSDIYARLTQAYSPRLAVRASCGVSAFSAWIYGFIVRFVKISAFFFSFLSSFNISRAQRRG